MKPLRRILAGLALTAAGLLATITGIITPADSAWGAPRTTNLPVTDTVDSVSVTLLDTAWGS